MKTYIHFIILILAGQLVLGQTPSTITKPDAGQSTYTVTGTVTLTAVQSITLGPGSWIQSGATFTAAVTGGLTAQDPYTSITFSDENYVFTRGFQTGMASFNSGTAKEGDVLEQITYFDGLGRPMQQLAIKSAPDKEDLLVHMEYDPYGRQEKEWLPYHEPTGSLGTYRGDKATATQQYYQTEYAADFSGLTTANVNAYSQKEFEHSELNRPLKQGAPGKDWKVGNGHEIEFAYEGNAANEVRRFNVTLTFANNTYTPTLVQNGHYAPGELYKTVTRDENHDSGADHTTEEFTDKLGRVVLKRTHNSGDHDTYYVYDDYGNLSYVLPPKVTTSTVSSTELSELCYQYKYDHRNRLVEKKIPGKGWEYIVYNQLDQPILTQDANLDTANQWLFTKYDAFGRVVYTGLISSSSSRITLQTAADNATAQYESRQTSSPALADSNVLYSNSAYPNTISMEIHTVNYYDSYEDEDGLSMPATVLGQAKASSTQGLPTVSKVRVLGTTDWITTLTGYDVKGRPIYVASKNNYLNTTDVVETELDFGGKVIQTKAIHSRTGNVDIVTEDSFEYDHEARLITQKQQINSGAEENLVHNAYDELGQLTSKQVGDGLQTVDYAYNVRGWLKQINDPASLGSDLFAFDINYNTADHSGTALYNGNISETEWKTANDNVLRWYRYSYDALNRISSGTDSSGNYNLVSIGYDKNGNITALNRKGHTNSGATSFGTMDNLVYTYDSGNKLTKVLDNGNDTYGFKDGVDTTTEYTYDTNGNMKTDANKGITSITYNHLNLPTQVTLSGGSISYIYDATGVKQKKTVNETGQSAVTTEYAGNYVYENSSLIFFNHPEGYVEPDGSGWDYIYQYKDHLGNIRLAYSDDNNNGSIASSEIREENNYYPFGLKHKGYNGGQSGRDHKFEFQGQEFNEDLDLNVHEFKYRMHDPAIGRFWQIDPLAEDYVYNGTYNFAENRVIDGVELEGLEWVDTNGNLVYDPSQQNDDGTTGGFTENSTVDHRNLARSLRQTETGEAQFQTLVNSNIPVETIVNNEDKPGSKEDKPIGAITVPKGVMEGSDLSGNVVDVTIKKFEITFFLKNIDDQAAALNDKDNSTGATLNGTPMDEGFNFSDIIGAIFGHEIGHTDKENVIIQSNNGDVEKIPTEISNKIIEEIRANKRN